MELDFDKEIDAILRNERRDSPAIPASRHLDADEISAFAENAMPEKSRSLYAVHLADCDRCRKILSGVLVLSAEAVPVAAKSPSVITIAERSVPWYRKLFLFPNVAYVMGGLVLIFGGFLAFSVIQNSREPLTAGLSEQPASAISGGEGGPRFEFNESESLNSNSANSAANVVANAMPMSAANANAAAGTATKSAGGPQAPENSFTMDGVSTADSSVAQPAAAPAPMVTGAAPTAAEPVAAPKTVPGRDDDAKAKNEDKEVVRDSSGLSKKDSAVAKQQAGVQVQSGPMNNDRGYNRQVENLDLQARRVQKPADEAATTTTGGRKVVSGRTFERKQGVWYDTTYQGHPTINVRRGSDEFKRLDGGLRNIANSMSGTIVVVWGAKAYRIQ